MNWRKATESVGPGAEALKRELPVPWVLRQAGVEVQGSSAVCPWHNDESPSLDFTVQSDVWLWNCSPCGRGGDVLDLVEYLSGRQHRNDRSFFTAGLEKATALWRDYVAAGKPSVEVARKVRAGSPDAWLNYARDAWAKHEPDLLSSWVEERGWGRLDPEWLHAEWLVSAIEEDGNRVLVVPFLDEAKTFAGYKFRLDGAKPIGPSGWKTTEGPLYGAWKDEGRSVVVLCEGESDTWHTARAVGHWADVLGLPAGATAKPRERWLSRFDGRTVVLCLDADDAGRRGARAWVEALLDRAKCTSVRIAVLEDGADAAGSVDLARRIERAVAVKEGSVLLTEVGGELVRQTAGGPVTVLNTTVRVLRWVEDAVGDTGRYHFEVQFGDGSVGTISPEDVCGKSQITKWALRHQFAWTGSVNDAQELMKNLLAEEPWVPHVHGVSLAGWHEDTFVLPGVESIGPRKLVWTPEENLQPDYDNAVDIRRTAPVNIANLLGSAMEVHERSVTTPVLAWLAAAPWRSRCRYFPVLAVSGASGYGKTTLLEELMRTFGWTTHLSLQKSTEFAIFVNAVSTNCIPIFFDEYTVAGGGYRGKALDAAASIVRAAWDGSRVQRGGVDPSRFTKLTSLPVMAPLIIAGEAVFDEQAMRDRSVGISLPGRGSERSLERLRSINDTSRVFGGLYLEWLTENRWRTPPGNLGDRQRTVLEVLRWGWEMLRDFTLETTSGKFDVGELDLTRVRREFETGASSYLEVLRSGFEWKHYDDGGALVWADSTYVYVRLTPLYSRAQRDGLGMPGNREGLKRWLEQEFAATGPMKVQHVEVGKRVEAMILPRDRLEAVLESGPDRGSDSAETSSDFRFPDSV